MSLARMVFFSILEINRLFALFDSKKRRESNESEEEPTRRVVVVPFYQAFTNRLPCLLLHKQLWTISYPHKKLKPCLHSVKDPLSMNVPGV